MKVTSRETYKVVRAVLEMRKFTQYGISKRTGVTFSLVNRVVNWLLSRGYVARRRGNYELVAPGAVFGIFPLFRKMKPFASFDVNLSGREALRMLRKRGSLCLTSALAYYDDYFRDPAIHAYVEDAKLAEELRRLPKGYTHIEIYEEDLNKEDFVVQKGQKMTGKVRTIIDLFCSNKAYAAERLIKREWV